MAYQTDAEPLEAMFELNDTLFAKANVHETDEVYLWLGVCPYIHYSVQRDDLTATGQRNARLPFARGRDATGRQTPSRSSEPCKLPRRSRLP